MPTPTHQLLRPDWREYELLDSGGGRKLERFGPKIIVRDEPKAWWKPSLAASEWQLACNELDPKTGLVAGRAETAWLVPLRDLKFRLRLTPGSRHVGAFPEMEAQWSWLRAHLESMPPPKPKLLNLFGYTGIASVVAASAGADVVHVDASRPSLDWARENAELNAAAAARGSIRLMLDDALAFVSREIRRKNQYQAIILDPPSYGRGPKGQVWKAEENLGELLAQCRTLLDPANSLFVITLYNLSISAYTLRNLLRQIFGVSDAQVEIGEVALRDTSAGNILSLANFARFRRG